MTLCGIATLAKNLFMTNNSQLMESVNKKMLQRTIKTSAFYLYFLNSFRYAI
jgi:hypothetical protein